MAKTFQETRRGNSRSSLGHIQSSLLVAVGKEVLDDKQVDIVEKWHSKINKRREVGLKGYTRTGSGRYIRQNDLELKK